MSPSHTPVAPAMPVGLLHVGETNWTYDEVVVSDFDAKRERERPVERETGTGQQDVLTTVRQHRDGQIDGTRASTRQYDVLRVQNNTD